MTVRLLQSTDEMASERQQLLQWRKDVVEQAAAKQQLMGVTGVAVEGLTTSLEFNSVYLLANHDEWSTTRVVEWSSDREGWPRFESAEGKHLFRSSLRNRWSLASQFDQFGEERHGDVDDQVAGALPVGVNVWLVDGEKVSVSVSLLMTESETTAETETSIPSKCACSLCRIL